jgi:serine O-acetyltransferase
VAEDAATREGDQWTISAPTAWDTSSFAGLVAVLREDREATSASLHLPGFQALAVHRIGEWIRSDGFPRLLRRPAAVLHRIMWGYVRNVLGFEIHKSVRLGRRVKFHHQHGVVIDARCVIGDDCVFYHRVTLAGSHRVDSPTSLFQAPQVGSRVSFGAGCIVLGGVRIGDGATIGPNAIVTTDVPPGASAVAQPARILRIR